MGRHDRRQGVAAGILILAVGLSVRFPITSVSPLLGDIGASYGLTETGLAILSAIPVLLFGLASPLAPLLVARFGLDRAISILLAVLAISTILRPINNPMLFAGTILVGASIALLGILAPQIIRFALPEKGGFWTGVYTTSFGVSAASGAAFSVPLLHMLGDQTSSALMSWGVPLLIALGLALALGPRIGSGANLGREARLPSSKPILRVQGLWPVTGFFASQALIYFTLTAWLPTIAVDRGMAPAQAGLLLAWMSIAGLPASLIAPMLASKERLRTPLITGVAILSAASLIGLACGPVAIAPLVVAVLGIAQSAAFGLAIALIVFTSPSVTQTAACSAASQGIGYTIAAAGPLLVGFFAQHGLSWSTIVSLLVIAAVGELVFGVAGSRASKHQP